MDEKCGLCTSTKSQIVRSDKDERVRIVPIGSDLGQSLLCHDGLDPGDPQSWSLLRDGVAFDGLSAALRLFPSISVSYAPLFIMFILPTSWRDALYRMVARNRYRWFGRADLCAMPDPGVQSRLISSRAGDTDRWA
ncbi:MAG: DCC1-like thiol-disulfide oxidoreductase family protein [Pseudomonadota bacterium]